MTHLKLYLTEKHVKYVLYGGGEGEGVHSKKMQSYLFAKDKDIPSVFLLLLQLQAYCFLRSNKHQWIQMIGALINPLGQKSELSVL